jgi:hypothetical protein
MDGRGGRHPFFHLPHTHSPTSYTVHHHTHPFLYDPRFFFLSFGALSPPVDVPFSLLCLCDRNHAPPMPADRSRRRPRCACAPTGADAGWRGHGPGPQQRGAHHVLGHGPLALWRVRSKRDGDERGRRWKTGALCVSVCLCSCDARGHSVRSDASRIAN